VLTTAGATVADDITALLANITGHAHKTACVVSTDGNTYVAETLSGTLGATDTTLIELMGSHSFNTSSIWSGTSPYRRLTKHFPTPKL
jgi:hypothetical protein